MKTIDKTSKSKLKKIDKTKLAKCFENIFIENSNNCFNCLHFKMLTGQELIAIHTYSKMEAQCTNPLIKDVRKRITNMESLYGNIKNKTTKRIDCEYFEDSEVGK